MILKNSKKFCIITILLFLLSSCSYFQKKNGNEVNKEVENVKKKERFEPNIDERIEKRVDEGGGGFIFGQKKENMFGDQNIMWVATMKALENIPLSLASYNGGVIETDWYGNGSELIKIRVNFLSSSVGPNSMRVNSYKKICNNLGNNCKINGSNSNFNAKIKDKIFEITRELNTQKAKN